MGVLTEIRPELGVDEEAIAAFCRAHGIRWLAVFGSVLRDDFGPESDVDVLVEFDPEQKLGWSFWTLDEAISPLFGDRKVDLVMREGLSRWIRDEVLAEAVVLYDATR